MCLDHSISPNNTGRTPVYPLDLHLDVQTRREVSGRGLLSVESSGDVFRLGQKRRERRPETY